MTYDTRDPASMAAFEINHTPKMTPDKCAEIIRRHYPNDGNEACYRVQLELAEKELNKRPEWCDNDLQLCALLRHLRGTGWSVAVHNDYVQDRKRYTFWLFTHPIGKWIKGEGETDYLAVQQAFDSRVLTEPLP